jgi:hypothetical protein
MRKFALVSFGAFRRHVHTVRLQPAHGDCGRGRTAGLAVAPCSGRRPGIRRPVARLDLQAAIRHLIT